MSARTVLVTGGGSGIGAATAEAFAADGARVFVCDISGDRAGTVAGRIGAAAEPLVLDVSDEEAVRAAFVHVLETAGRLDVLVNNAGIGDGQRRIVDTTTEVWRRVQGINLDGVFFCAREAARIMLDQGSGRIVNVASVSTFSGRANGVPYTASKGAVFSLTRRLACELGPHGITANTILPGAIETGISATTQEVLGDDMPPPAEPAAAPPGGLFSRIPAGRRGSADEVASAAVFLASDGASYVNGVTLPVDGGWLAM